MKHRSHPFSLFLLLCCANEKGAKQRRRRGRERGVNLSSSTFSFSLFLELRLILLSPRAHAPDPRSRRRNSVVQIPNGGSLPRRRVRVRKAHRLFRCRGPETSVLSPSAAAVARRANLQRVEPERVLIPEDRRDQPEPEQVHGAAGSQVERQGLS